MTVIYIQLASKVLYTGINLIIRQNTIQLTETNGGMMDANENFIISLKFQ